MKENTDEKRELQVQKGYIHVEFQITEIISEFLFISKW